LGNLTQQTAKYFPKKTLYQDSDTPRAIPFPPTPFWQAENRFIFLDIFEKTKMVKLFHHYEPGIRYPYTVLNGDLYQYSEKK
jgi:hypothetical protein